MANGSVEDTIDTNVIGWISEYAAFSTWQAFSSGKEINRDFLQGLLNIGDCSPLEHGTSLSLHRIVLLCRLLDGEEYSLSFDSDEAQPAENMTVLENAVELLDEVVTEDALLNTNDLAKLRLSIIIQAVFVCVRDGNFKEARNVYDRLKSRHNDERFTWWVEPVLSSHEPNHPNVKQHPYKSMLQVVVDTMQPLYDHYNPPFLVRVAQQVKVHHNRFSQKKIRQQPMFLKLPEIKLFMQQHSIDENVLEETSRSKAAWGKIGKIRQDKGRYLQNIPTCLQDQDLSLREEEQIVEVVISRKSRSNRMATTKTERNEELEGASSESNSSPVRHNTSTKKTPVLRDRSPLQSDEESDLGQPSRNDDLNQSLASRLGGRPAVLKTKPGVQRWGLKRPWKAEEEEMLFRKVCELGTGCWKDMVQFFTMRTNVDIKDKWRNMCKIPERYGTYAVKYGDIM